MRTFISSTVYDLIDVRAELGELLRSIGVVPVLSDDKLSDFRVHQDENSIETCLTNVESCDEFVLVLNQRYGPRLGKFGFDDISATHLEYRRAVDRKIPIHVYIRDRLDADYTIWKKNGRSNDLDLSWVSKRNFGLFELLDEHSKLTTNANNNWYFAFTSSVDLTSAVGKYFGSRILPQRLVQAIQTNSFPLFTIDLEVSLEVVAYRQTLKCRATLVNAGGAPAFKCKAKWQEDSKESKDFSIVVPGQSFLMSYLYGHDDAHHGTTKFIVVEYDSPIGVTVTDLFEVHAHMSGSPTAGRTWISGGTLVDRKFRRSSGIELKIDGE